MATISDKLWSPDGTALTSQDVFFYAHRAPWFRSTGATSPGAIKATTNASTGIFTVTLLEGVYAVKWRTGSALGGALTSEKFIAVPVGTDTYTLSQVEVTQSSLSSYGLEMANSGTITSVDDQLIAWVEGENYSILTAESDESGAITSAVIMWPDESAGTYTVTSTNDTFLTPETFEFYHLATGKTISQGVIVLNDETGALVSKPRPVVTPSGDVLPTAQNSVAGTTSYYTTASGFRASTDNSAIVIIGHDDTGRTGIFVRNMAVGTEVDDGANYLTDAAGSTIKRLI